MGRINNISTAVQSVQTLEDLRRYVAAALEAIVIQINGKLTFGQNVQTFGPVTASFDSITPTKIIHGLGRVPQGYIVTSVDSINILTKPDVTLYPWTSTQIFLTGFAPGNADVLLF